MDGPVKKTPEQQLQEVSDIIVDSMRSYIGEAVTPKLLAHIKFMLIETMLNIAGFELKFEPVSSAPDEICIQPSDRLTAFVCMAARLGIPLPDPRNLKDPWETPAGTVSFDEQTKAVTLVPKKPVDYIEINFKI